MPTWVLGEFGEEARLLEAARRLRALGHTRLDLHSPVPLAGADEALGLKRSVVPRIALAGGATGTATAFLMQWWMNTVDYPINVGGRALFAWPSWVPICFELTVLFSALSIVFGLFGLAGFPRLHHPLFEVDGFRSASVDGLWISAAVERPAAGPVAEELRRLGAAQVSTVEEEP